MRLLFLLLLIIILFIASACSGEGGGGCCEGGCGGCCGSNDLSKDADSDGSVTREAIPVSLNRPDTTENRRPELCDASDSTDIRVSGSRSQTANGYRYSYSYSIAACDGTVGYIVKLQGPPDKIVESYGIARDGTQITGSQTVENSRQYRGVCISTSQSQNTCQAFS